MDDEGSLNGLIVDIVRTFTCIDRKNNNNTSSRMTCYSGIKFASSPIRSGVR